MSNLRGSVRVTRRQGLTGGFFWHSAVSQSFPLAGVAMRIVLRTLTSSHCVNRGSPVRAAAAGFLIALALSCSDSPSGPEAGAPASPFVVSAPQSTATARYSGTRNAVSASSETRFVYVALPAGAIPNADVVTIRVQSSGVVVNAKAVDGGLDPVAIAAEVDDTLQISVSITGSTVPVTYRMAVPRMGQPIVIRTSPPPKKRDVPLNSYIVVTFSEPISSASLTPTAVVLTTGGVPVPAKLAFGDFGQLTSVLIPDATLAPLTEYTLTVTQAIRNLDGQPLIAPVTVQFTTEGQPLTSGAAMYHVTGTVADGDTGAPMQGAVHFFFDSDPAPGSRGSELLVITDSDGKFSADLLAVRYPAGTVPPSVAGQAIAFAAVYGSATSTYDTDARYVLAGAELQMRLYKHRQIVAGESLEMTISPDDGVCFNNVMDMHPWPTEWLCRRVYVLPPADGSLTIYAGACEPTCLPIELMAEATDGSTLYWSLYPTGTLEMPVKRGLPMQVDVGIPWGSPRQSFILRTSFTPAP